MLADVASLLLWEEYGASGFPVPPRMEHGQREDVLPRLLPQAQHVGTGISNATVKVEATT